MNRVLISFGIVLSLVGCASAEPVAESKIPVVEMKGKVLGPDASMEQVLDALDQVGQGLKDFDANVSMGQQDNVSGEDAKRTGRVWYRLVGEGDAQVHVIFDKRIIGNRLQEKKVEYLLADGWLTDRDYDRKAEVRRQVVKPGQKVNLLKLGEGPFPLPIGQKRDDVLAVFDVKKMPVVKDDPAGTVHLQLSPKAGTSFERKFKAIDVWVDRKTHFPTRIETLDKNETTTRTTDLSEIRVNVGAKDDDFSLPKVDGDWQTTQEEYAE